MKRWRSQLINAVLAKYSTTVVVVFLIAVVAAGKAYAQRNLEQVAGFIHTVWSQNDGVPDYIYSMAQTPDGWIWLASRKNLYRFDGVSAELYQVASEDATTLITIFATKSGDLWLGYQSGRTLVLTAGDFAHPHIVRGLDSEPSEFLQDAQGNMWARTINGLFKANQFEWHRVDQASGVHGRYFYAASIDTDGTLWALSDDGLFSLASGRTRFEQRSDIPGDWYQINPTNDQASLTHFSRYGYFYLGATLALAGKQAAPSYSGSHYGALFDAEGGVWFQHASSVYRARTATLPVLKKIAQDVRAGITTDQDIWAKMSPSRTLSVMEDRQHNIWLGTVSGLERFRPSVVTTLDLPSGVFNYAMLPSESGSIWFGNAVSDDNFRWWHVDHDVQPVVGYNLDTTVAYRDSDGSVLLGTGEGDVQRFANGKFEPLDSLPPGASKGDDIIAIVRDGHQRLWIGIRGYPIYQLNNGRWIANGGLHQLPGKGVLRAVTDSRGRLWLSYPHELFVIDGDHVTRYTSDDGMIITNVRDIIADGIPVVGGDTGLAAFDGNRFHEISALDPTVLSGINGMVRLKDGTLWLNGHQGGVRITADELKHGMEDPTYKISLRLFGISEGMPGTAQPNRPVPSLIEDTDGRLWFANSQGIAWLDPTNIPRSNVDPTVVIRSLTAGDQSYQPDALTHLPAGTRNIRIDYTAVGLSDASKARFRYQLAGVENDWQDAGNRREAFYTNLGPGTYQFRVTVSNEDGVWSNTGANVRFSIEPYFYQTKWFRVICICIGLAFLWLAYLYRLRRVMQRLQQRLEDRHEERDRIARELHDTYLQTVQGLVLKIHAASRKLPEGSARDGIVDTLKLADEALAEGRDRVSALRASVNNRASLAMAFEEIAKEFEADGFPLLNVTSTGTQRPVDPLVTDELYASGREAIVNAFNHSRAESISVVVSYEKRGLKIEICDNGQGMDPKVLSYGGLPGHWGLRGIRERMERIGGTCRIISDNGNGTTVILSVEASRAYIKRPHFR
jgi:signal transduction histidine kinase/ligand-binding sensor domain-containing protein